MKSFIPEGEISELALRARFTPAHVANSTLPANSALSLHADDILSTRCTHTHTHTLTCVSLVVFQHIDLLGKLAVTLLALVLFNPLVQLHVVPESVLGLHAYERELTGEGCSHVTQILRGAAYPFRTLHRGSLGCRRGP